MPMPMPDVRSLKRVETLDFFNYLCSIKCLLYQKNPISKDAYFDVIAEPHGADFASGVYFQEGTYMGEPLNEATYFWRFDTKKDQSQIFKAIKKVKDFAKPRFAFDDSILKKAFDLVHGERAAAYGSITDNFGRIAKMWSTVTGTDITIKQVGLMMVLLKISRELGKESPDNLIDAAGYLACIEKYEKCENKL